MNQKLQTKVDLLKPDLAKRVTAKQEKQKSTHDYHASNHPFQVGDEVYFRSNGCQGELLNAPDQMSVSVELLGGFVVQ